MLNGSFFMFFKGELPNIGILEGLMLNVLNGFF